MKVRQEAKQHADPPTCFSVPILNWFVVGIFFCSSSPSYVAWLHAPTEKSKPFHEMGSIQALWKWGVISCIAVAWLCQARAISDLYRNKTNTTHVGVKGVNRGKTNHSRCIESFVKMLDPAFANVLGR